MLLLFKIQLTFFLVSFPLLVLFMFLIFLFVLFIFLLVFFVFLFFFTSILIILVFFLLSMPRRRAFAYHITFQAEVFSRLLGRHAGMNDRLGRCEKCRQMSHMREPIHP